MVSQFSLGIFAGLVSRYALPGLFGEAVLVSLSRLFRISSLIALGGLVSLSILGIIVMLVSVFSLITLGSSQSRKPSHSVNPIHARASSEYSHMGQTAQSS